MLLDARGAALDVTEPPGTVNGAERADNILGLVGYVRLLREDDGFLDYSGRMLA
jgi:hypothetical protein